MKESEIQSQCLDWLKANGYFAIKLHLGPIKIGSGRNVRNPMAGAPDIFALKDGIYYGIEVKKAGGKVSDRQSEWHDKAERSGGALIVVVNSLQDMIDKLNGWDF